MTMRQKLLPGNFTPGPTTCLIFHAEWPVLARELPETLRSENNREGTFQEPGCVTTGQATQRIKQPLSGELN